MKKAKGAARFAVRKTAVLVEEILLEGGQPDGVALRRVTAMAAINNPYVGKPVADLKALIAYGATIGDLLAEKALAQYGKRAKAVESYGKGAIVGVQGEIEHGYAAITRPFATRVRKALGDCTAWMAANVKRGALGATLDVPMAYKDALYVRSHYDTVEAMMPDGPLPDEIVVILVTASRGRLHARIGGLEKSEVRGRDRYLDRK
ncbi:MAG: amino acid synthesis family protein [Burkholderiales bacterium]